MSGRRVLVVGPYPPTRDPLGIAVLDDVRSRRRAGDAVEVGSPEPSAAHHGVDPTTAVGLARFARLAAGFDLVVVHYRPDLVEPAGSARARASVARLWPLVARRLPAVEVVEYRSEAGRGVAGAALVARAGGSVPGKTAVRGLVAPAEAWPDDRDAVQRLVTTRAAAERDRATADPDAQLRAVPPLRLAVPTSGRPGVTTVRRILQRLVAWELDPLVGHVNRLRSAVLRDEAEAGSPSEVEDQGRDGDEDQGRDGDQGPSASDTTSA